MVTVEIYSKVGEEFDFEPIEIAVKKTLREHGVVERAECSVEVVSRQLITHYAMEYLKEEESEAAEHPVLSFVQNELEGEFVNPPDGVEHLGEIIVSYDHAKVMAAQNGTSVTDEMAELASHATLHLLGIHHD